MNPLYANPAVLKATLDQRCRDDAARKDRPATWRKQLLLQDRFAARVCAVGGPRAVLRGPLALDIRTGRARCPRDLEMSIDIDPDRVLSLLQNAGQHDLGDYLVFQVHIDWSTPVLLEGGLQIDGQRFRVEPQLVGVPFGSPFFLNVLAPAAGDAPDELLSGDPLLGFAGIAPSSLRVFPLVAQLAEALHFYTLNQGTTHPRVRDLPDLALIASAGPLDAAAARAAIDALFYVRATHSPPSWIAAPPATWARPIEALIREDRLSWKTIEEILGVVRQFVVPLLAGQKGSWDPGTWRWIPPPEEERPEQSPTPSGGTPPAPPRSPDPAAR